jgi:hypothetical protein
MSNKLNDIKSSINNKKQGVTPCSMLPRNLHMAKTLQQTQQNFAIF